MGTARDPRALTVFDIVKIVLPDGTLGTKKWDKAYQWPPDLFAAVAFITDRSGLYSEQAFTATWSADFRCKRGWIRGVRKISKEWATTGAPPKEVQTMWQDLVRKHGSAPIADHSPAALAWKTIVFDLLVIADEVCAGVGFSPDPGEEAGLVQYIVSAEYVAMIKRASEDPHHTGGDLLPHLPFSLCMHVPPSLLCVQPKTTTPSVGCTVRSLTHNLALLPSVSNVRTSWFPPEDPRRHNDPFNILVVPFPFSIPGRSFEPKRYRDKDRDPTFALDPDKWMN